MGVMKPILIAIIACLVLAAPAAARDADKYEGTVVSVDRDARTFKLRDGERGTIRIKVTGSTVFQRVSFAGLKKGMRRVEATVKRSNGRWVATKVERD
jgi:hypothetical protein